MYFCVNCFMFVFSFNPFVFVLSYRVLGFLSVTRLFIFCVLCKLCWVSNFVRSLLYMFLYVGSRTMFVPPVYVFSPLVFYYILYVFIVIMFLQQKNICINCFLLCYFLRTPNFKRSWVSFQTQRNLGPTIS